MLQLAVLADRQQQLPVGSGSMCSIPKQCAWPCLLQQRVKVGGVLQAVERHAGKGWVWQLDTARTRNRHQQGRLPGFSPCRQVPPTSATAAGDETKACQPAPASTAKEPPIKRKKAARQG